MKKHQVSDWKGRIIEYYEPAEVDARINALKAELSATQYKAAHVQDLLNIEKERVKELEAQFEYYNYVLKHSREEVRSAWKLGHVSYDMFKLCEAAAGLKQPKE